MIIRYFAAARASTGIDQESLGLAAGMTFAELLGELAAKHPSSLSSSAPALAELLPRCSFLRNEIALRDQAAVLTDSDVIDVLPPFAGG